VVLGQVLLLALGLYFFAQAFSGVDLTELADAIKAGSIPLLILALAVGQLPRFTWAPNRFRTVQWLFCSWLSHFSISWLPTPWPGWR
jgi:hypothetical protein